MASTGITHVSVSSPIDYSPDPEKHATTSPPVPKRLEWHPLSSIILSLWLVYIAVLIWLLERVSDPGKLSYPLSWWYDTLPDLLLTGFAQGHAAITAMHLARLAVSALHNESTSARTWAELFWLSDRTWQGPIGLGTTLWDRWRMGLLNRFSTTFVAFALTCFIAIPTPYILQRAYDEQSVSIPVNRTLLVDTFAPEALADLRLVEQQSTGEGAWVTGLPLTDMYNTTLFTPQGRARDQDSNDFLLAGSFAGKLAYDLDTLRVEAECEAVPMPSDFPTLEQGDFGWGRWCNATFPDFEKPYWVVHTLNSPGRNLDTNTSFCLDYDNTDERWLYSGSAHTTGYVAFQSMDRGVFSTGMIKCQSSITVGRVLADGRDGTFQFFAAQNYGLTTGLKAPLFVALWDAILPFTVAESGPSLTLALQEERLETVLRLFGYQPLPGREGARFPRWRPPNATQLAKQVQRGALCMGAAIGVLGKRPDQTVGAISEFHPVSARQRKQRYVWAAGALLVAWFVMMLYCTVRLFRRTFAPALGSYSVGRLLATTPALVEDAPVGELAVNAKLKTPFGRVGDPNVGAEYGHVAPTYGSRPEMSPKLSYQRNYGARSPPATAQGNPAYPFPAR